MAARLGRARARCPGCPGSVSRARPPNRTCVSPRIRLSTCLARCSAAGGGGGPGSRDVRHAVAVAGHGDAGGAGEHDPVPNRRAESSLAQRCNLSCIRRTVAQAEPSSGHATTPVFTSVSPSLAVCSLTDTLPPFPMWPAFPSSEYYDGSAPSAPVSRHRTYPPVPRLAGAFAGMSDEWFPRSLLFGSRIRHPALPLRPRHGYAVDLHHGLPG